jgi:hypothetical protein
MMKAKGVDPLYVIFEKHLFAFQDPNSDRKTFVAGIVTEYMTFLQKQKIAIPRGLETVVREELATQVETMLIKKIYGCLNLTDYVSGTSVTVKRRATKNYESLQALPAPKKAPTKARTGS